jgi:hypothetical protein
MPFVGGRCIELVSQPTGGCVLRLCLEGLLSSPRRQATAQQADETCNWQCDHDLQPAPEEGVHKLQICP